MIKIESMLDTNKIQVGDLIRKDTIVKEVININWNKNICPVYKLKTCNTNEIEEHDIVYLQGGEIINR